LLDDGFKSESAHARMRAFGSSWASSYAAWMPCRSATRVRPSRCTAWFGQRVAYLMSRSWTFGMRLSTASRRPAATAAPRRGRELDLSSYDRFFPFQDFMPKGSFGNLIALPLQGECLQRGTTAFLDPTTMRPWPEQWAFLSSVARLTRESAKTLAASLRPVDAGPALTLADLAKAPGPPPPATIRAQLGATISIKRSGLPPAVIAALKHLASIHNPVFFEKQRMRFSTWDTPRFIRCYQEDLEWIHLPRGLVERVVELVVGLCSRLEVTDVRPVHPTVGLGFGESLRPEQAKAVQAVIAHERGVIVAPPGSGKTVMACAVIAHHDAPTLVLVDRQELVDQWRDRLVEYLGVEPSQVGVVGGGKDRPTGIVDVAMIQSVARRDNPPPCSVGTGWSSSTSATTCQRSPSRRACARQTPVGGSA